MTTWLGIDPGLAIVGWAILRDNSELMPILVDYGTIETSKNLSTAQRLIEIERDLKELIAEYKPGEIAVEMPFFNRQIKAAQASWKCHLGHGRATKAEVAEQIKYLFGLTKMPINDAVDAIAIAYAAFSGVRNQIS